VRLAEIVPSPAPPERVIAAGRTVFGGYGPANIADAAANTTDATANMTDAAADTTDATANTTDASANTTDASAKLSA
jgi:hypothetical protein